MTINLSRSLAPSGISVEFDPPFLEKLFAGPAFRGQPHMRSNPRTWGDADKHLAEKSHTDRLMSCLVRVALVRCVTGIKAVMPSPRSPRGDRCIRWYTDGSRGAIQF